jgi:Thiolase, N-terminal domain
VARSFGATTAANNKGYGFTTKDPVVVVAGVRLPFAMTSTIYEDQLAVDLQRLAIQGLLTQSALAKEEVDYIICGNVIQEVKTSNIAREAGINAGLPTVVGAHTIAQACISANAAICAAAEKIMTGHASVVIAGGTETFSDVPIRLTRPIRQKLITMNKAMKKGGTIGGIQHLLKGLTMKDISVETPAIANYTTVCCCCCCRIEKEHAVLCLSNIQYFVVACTLIFLMCIFFFVFPPNLLVFLFLDDDDDDNDNNDVTE